MRIRGDILDTVAFVGGPDKQRKVRFRGTVFFVEEDAAPGSQKAWGYLVTAKHVAERLAEGRYYVRLNTRNDGGRWWSFAGQRWWTHPTDLTADAALLRWFPSADVVRYKRWNVSGLVTKRLVADGGVNIGDDIHTIGLFRAQPGEDENTPVVRFGNVAMVPKDPVKTAYGPMEAFLVECRSLGGLSGSPVIVTETMRHQIGNAYFKGVGEVRLLGLMHGHHDLLREGAAQDPEEALINTGIAVVVPAQKILDIISQPEMVALKEKELPDLLRGTAAMTMDLAFPQMPEPTGG